MAAPVTRARTSLRALFASKKWTRAAVADAIGVSRPSLTAWTQGDARPKPHHQQALERVVGIKASDWLTNEEYRIAFGRQRRAA